MTRLTHFLVAGLISALGTASYAATVDPASYNLILTEDFRTATVDGADVSGNAAVPGNGDVGTFTQSGLGGDSVLLVGNTLDPDVDRFEFTNVTGFLDVSILNFVRNSASTTNRARTRFDLFVNGSRVERINLAARAGDNESGAFALLELRGDDVAIRIQGRRGEADYDVGLNLAAIPLPAGLSLMTAGLIGLGAFGRRKRRGKSVSTFG